MGEAGISEPCGAGGEREGSMCCRDKHRPVRMGKQRWVCLLTKLHETLLSVSPLLCCVICLLY